MYGCFHLIGPFLSDVQTVQDFDAQVAAASLPASDADVVGGFQVVIVRVLRQIIGKAPAGQRAVCVVVTPELVHVI